MFKIVKYDYEIMVKGELSPEFDSFEDAYEYIREREMNDACYGYNAEYEIVEQKAWQLLPRVI